MTQFEGRFTDCDDTQFPAITDYNFLTNKLFRGATDTSFRWEDVVIAPIYLYRELTTSGSFEENLYTTYHTVTNPTGANFITNLTNLKDTTGFAGWTITGGYTLWIGQSGARYISGSLSGLTGNFSAFPITNLEAIGLWNHSSVTPASVISKSISTGIELINTGVCQYYALLRCNYSTGSGEYVIPTVRGWNSNTVVAYMNYNTATWDLTLPSPVFVPVNDYKEIKYNFQTTDFPAATPTGFDVMMRLVSTGGFITVDDIHLDSRLRKSAFQDFVLPTGYILEITPDLGWHNILDMFSDNGVSNNPHLRTFGLYSIQKGNLVDNLDNSVSAIIDSSDLSSVISDRYTKYLWRAIAVGNDSSLGKGGIPQKFNYVAESVFAKFAITSITNLANEFTKVIIGTKSSHSTIFVDDVEPINIEFPTPESWKLTLYINDINKIVKIQAGYNGVFSSPKYVELKLNTFTQTSQPLWNSFDEHGLLMDIERLPDESNDQYKLRIKDVFRGAGGATFIGVINGASRELGIKIISDAISFSISKSFNEAKHSNVYIDCASTVLKISHNNLLITEILYVDPVYKTFDLSYHSKELPISCKIINGKEVNIQDINIADDVLEFPNLKRLKISDEETYGKFIEVTYHYYYSFDFKEYTTIGALVDNINQLGIVDCVMSSKLSGNENTLGLYISSETLTPNTTLDISWSPIYLKQVSDKSFREYLRDNINYKKSQFYKYVTQLQSSSRTLWGSVEADRDYWDAASRTDLSFDHIPTLTDPPLAEFYSNSRRIDSIQSWARGYTGYNEELMKNIGISTSVFQPGVAYGEALQSELTLNIDTTQTTSTNNISPKKLNNNFILFSGQR